MREVCKYCEGTDPDSENDSLGFADISIFGDCAKVVVDAFLTDGEVAKLAVVVGNLRPITVEINYCPMCGRNLRGGEDESN